LRRVDLRRFWAETSYAEQDLPDRGLAVETVIAG
jgi:hypothetical protein